MKYLIIATLLYLWLPTQLLAVHNKCNATQTTEGTIVIPVQKDQTSFRKPNFIERFAIKLAQKSIVKKLIKQEAKSSLAPDEAGSGNPNKRGLVSLLFALVGVLFLFVPGGLAGIGGLFAIAGFILGIIGLKKDEDKTLALIGTIVGGLVLVLYLTVIYT